MVYSKMLREAAETIRAEDVSNYPIFVLHHGDTLVGIPLVEGGKLPQGWQINASTLEEFVAKQIISAEKIDDFRALYKSKPNELCLFVFGGESQTFVFSKQ